MQQPVQKERRPSRPNAFSIEKSAHEKELNQMLSRAQKDVEAGLSTYQALQRFYRTDGNYKLIEQVQNYRGEALGLMQLANIKRHVSAEIEDAAERKKYIELALADLKSAESIYHKLENMTGLATICGIKGQLYFNLGEYLMAKKEYENGLDIAIDINDRPLEANMRDYINNVEIELNRKRIDELSGDAENPTNLSAQEKEKLRGIFMNISKGTGVLNMEGVAELIATLGNERLTVDEREEISIQLGMKKNNGVLSFDIFWNWWKTG